MYANMASNGKRASAELRLTEVTLKGCSQTDGNAVEHNLIKVSDPRQELRRLSSFILRMLRLSLPHDLHTNHGWIPRGTLPIFTARAVFRRL